MDAERKTNYNKMALSYYNNSLILPCDKETINIRIDKRFLIDHSGTIDNPDAWIVTNRNVISKCFDKYDGVVELALSKHQFNHNVDSKEYMIADYFATVETLKEVDKAVLFDCRITYNGTSDLKMGTPFKKYIAEVYCDGRLNTTIPIIWEVVIDDETANYITYSANENVLNIKCKYDSSLMNSHIRLIAANEEYGFSAELPVKVVSNL